MDIIGTEFYEGQFMDATGSFTIIVEFPDSFHEFTLHPDKVRSLDRVHEKATLPTTPEKYVEAMGKFRPEIIALNEPVKVKTLDYDEVVEALRNYFANYGVYFA